MNYDANAVKENLMDQIEKLESIKTLFLSNPEKDFTRKRKLDFKETIRLILSMGGKSLKVELLEYFNFDVNAISKSGFVQQREKIHHEAFKLLFHTFEETLETYRTHNGYRLLAADGSDVNIAHNPDDEETYQLGKTGGKGTNLLHLNALYDIPNRVYIDALVQPRMKMNERVALVEMVERSSVDGKVIIVADRGYENYNVCEHITQRNWDYVIRVKDINSNGIASSLFLPSEETFDIDYSFHMTRRQTNEIREKPEKYKFLPKNQKFDFLPVGCKETYPFKFRILRFPITDTTHEVIMTSLDRNEFPLEKIKEIYHMRWGIETSFRQLKYSIGLAHFHAKKVAFILQEIYAKLTMYNFCESITNHVVIEQSDTQHDYQVNFTIAVTVCMHFFKLKNNMPQFNVEVLIQKNILPVRPGRKDPRKVKARSAISFLYRVT